MKRKSNILIVFLILQFSNGIFAQLSDSLRIDYNYINSVPQDAEVYINDEFTGNTPLFFTWKDTLFPKQIKIMMKGYADYVDNISSNSQINKVYTLVPLKGTGKINLVKEDKTTYFSKPRKVVPIVLSSLLAATGGISAYYFKSLALENRDAYETYGDQSALDRKKKYDIMSGVSLMVFQAGLFFLTYYLLMDN